MNHIYHSIWNEALGAWIAVSEIATGQGKRSSNRRKLNSRHSSRDAGIQSQGCETPKLLAISLLLATTTAHALPTGDQLVAGQATVTTPNTGQMQINQASQNAIINWQGFSIDQNQAVNIQQPNAQAALLNRVVGQDASQIQGQLNANGQVYLVNPNGVLFSKTAQVDVGGLIASTHNISNADFMNGNHHYTQNGSTASVDNQGNIKTPEGGIVVLIGKQVTNSGNIQTTKGTTALVAAKTVDLDFKGNGLIEVKVPEAALNTQITNQGAIKADGGQVILTANAAGQLIDTVINSQGVIQARGLAERNGVIKLDGGDNGTVKITGTLDTGSPNLGLNAIIGNTNQGLNSSGGNITVKGADIQLANSAKLNASGNTGGGTITLGDKQTTNQTTIQQGATVTANTLDSGTAGTINVLANMNDGKVQVDGQLNATAPKNGDGGFIDTSAAHVNVADTAKISTKAANGKTGKWLIDPTDYKIAASGGNLTGTALANYLNASNVEIQTLSTGSTGQGDIFVNDAVSWNNLNQLTLTAHRNVNINAPINANGGGSVKLRADSLGTGTGTVAFTGTGHITVNNGAVVGIYYNPVSYTDTTTKSDSSNPYGSKLTLNTGSYATDFMLVNDVNKLQAINTNLSGNYALGKNIDASATAGWNGGAGFAPLGNLFVGFSGKFNGLEHTITGLTINRPSTNQIGLFNITGGSISNIGLIGSNIVGRDYVGGLVGINQHGGISNAYVTGSITGRQRVGGLLGANLGGDIINAHATSSVTGNFLVGGLAGENQGGNITNSYSTGRVTGRTDFGSGSIFVGGLVGQNNGGTINNAYATGNISGNDSVGGLAGGNVGGMPGSNRGVISNSHATGNVMGNSQVGGLAGFNNNDINNAYATGNVTGNADSTVTGEIQGIGGLVGENNATGTINNAYATGNVTSIASNVADYKAIGGLVGINYNNINNAYSTGNVTGADIIDNPFSTMTRPNDMIGGLIGFNTSINNVINNSYWDTATSGQTTSAGGTGLTTALMKQQASFAGWDFVNTWKINQGVSYPTLQAANTTPVAQQGTRGAAVYTPLTTPLPVTSSVKSGPSEGNWTPPANENKAPVENNVPEGIKSWDKTTTNIIKAALNKAPQNNQNDTYTALYNSTKSNVNNSSKVPCQSNGSCVDIQNLSNPNSNTSIIPDAWRKLTPEQRANITKGSAFFAQSTGNKPETLENAAYDMRSSIDMVNSKAALAIGDIPDYEIADGIQLKDYLLSSASLMMKAKIWDDNLSLSNSLAQFDDNYINGKIDTSKFTQASDVVDKINNGEFGKKGRKSFGESLYDFGAPLVDVLKISPILAKYEAEIFLKPVVKMYDTIQTVGDSTIAAATILGKSVDIMKATGNLFTLGGAMYKCLSDCGSGTKADIGKSIDELKDFAISMQKLEKSNDKLFLTKIGVTADVLSLLDSIDGIDKAFSALKAVDKISENIIGSGDKSFIQSKISRERDGKILDAIIATGNILKHFTPQPQLKKTISFASDTKDILQTFSNNTSRFEAKSIEAYKSKYDANSNLLSGAIITKSVALRDYTQKLGEITAK